MDGLGLPSPWTIMRIGAQYKSEGDCVETWDQAACVYCVVDDGRKLHLCISYRHGL